MGIILKYLRRRDWICCDLTCSISENCVTSATSTFVIPASLNGFALRKILSLNFSATVSIKEADGRFLTDYVGRADGLPSLVGPPLWRVSNRQKFTPKTFLWQEIILFRIVPGLDPPFFDGPDGSDFDKLPKPSTFCLLLVSHPSSVLRPLYRRGVDRL